MAGLLEIRGLSKRFGGVYASRDVSFDVEAGAIVGLIGPNGAGKTTLFNLVTGFLAPRPRGEALAGVTSRARARAGAQRCLELVGIAHKAADLARNLSTGQRKRLEMARAMATRPRLLLLDELTGGVDQPSIPALIELVARLRGEGITLLVIEHNRRVIMGLADKVVFLHLGEKLAEGAPAEIARHPTVVSLYLGSHHA